MMASSSGEEEEQEQGEQAQEDKGLAAGKPASSASTSAHAPPHHEATWVDTGLHVAGTIASGALTVAGFVASAATQISTGVVAGAAVGGVTGALGGFAASTANVATSLAISTVKVGVSGVAAVTSTVYTAAKDALSPKKGDIAEVEYEAIPRKGRAKDAATDPMCAEDIVPRLPSLYDFPEVASLSLDVPSSMTSSGHAVSRFDALGVALPSAPPLDASRCSPMVPSAPLELECEAPAMSAPPALPEATTPPTRKPLGSRCTTCEKAFGFQTWRFQCPACEDTFCGSCLGDKSHVAPAAGVTTPATLCKGCLIKTCASTCEGRCLEDMPVGDILAYVERQGIQHGAVSRPDLVQIGRAHV